MPRLWTPDDIQFLLANWLTKSAKQIGKILNRTRSAVCGMIGRLRQRGVDVPRTGGGGAGKKFHINPHVGQTKSRKPKYHCENKVLAVIPPPQKFHRVSEPLTTDPCTLLELEARQCHWPLGDLLDPPRLFCGAPSLDGLPYCDHHALMAYQKEPNHGRSRH